MKTYVPSALADHYLLETTTLAIGIRIIRNDLGSYGLTTSDIPATIAGIDHIPGLQVKNVDIQAGLAVGNLELLLLDDTSLITREEADSGIWRNASFLMFEYNFEAPDDGINPLCAGTFGELTLYNAQIKVELRGLQQALQQTIGNATSKTCRARLGDTLCLVNLASYTVTGTLTAVMNKQQFADSSRAEVDDWFAEGALTFTSGLCAGLSQKVKYFDGSSGYFTLSLPMVPLPAIGDTYSVTAGCRKRLPEDCFAKFNNVINFQGEYHLPGMDELTKPLGIT